MMNMVKTLVGLVSIPLSFLGLLRPLFLNENYFEAIMVNKSMLDGHVEDEEMSSQLHKIHGAIYTIMI